LVKRRNNVRARAPDVSVAFERDPSAPARVRRALRALLGDPDDPIANEVETVASELVSNVVLHTKGGGTADAWDPKPDIPFRLEVTDSSSQPPVPVTPRHDGGRGLRIVNELAHRWGVEPAAQGKTVWVEFDRSDPDEPPDG
jgi:anti-sigma regulatory factor (Ser/Thr protein kinase)